MYASYINRQRDASGYLKTTQISNWSYALVGIQGGEYTSFVQPHWKNIKSHFSWADMKTGINLFVKSFLHCISTSEVYQVPTPLWH